MNHYRIIIWRWIETREGRRLVESEIKIQPQTLLALSEEWRRQIRRARQHDPSIDRIERWEGEYCVMSTASC